MDQDRRRFLKGSLAAGIYGLARVDATQAADPDAATLQQLAENRKYLCPPDGEPPDLEARKSPNAEPFVTELFVPIVPVPVAKLDPPPRPEAHQRYDEFLPKKFYEIREKEDRWEYHKDWGRVTWSWGYEYLGRVKEGAKTIEKRVWTTPGPAFHARYGEPVLVRRFNSLPHHRPQQVLPPAAQIRRPVAPLPAVLPPDGYSRLLFAMPSTTQHLHNAHTPSESDGNPQDWIDTGEYWDHHYPNIPSGHDDRERLSTLWYHDHRLGFTAANIYAGLDGFYSIFDEVGSGQNEDDVEEKKGWRLPAGEHDVPLILHDLLFARDTNGRPQLLFPNINTDGVLGDRYTVNRKIQPFFEVKRRKYRFRVLNGGPSRFYELYLYSDKPGAKAIPLKYPFTILAGDGNLQPNPIDAKSIFLGVSQRVEVVIDFADKAFDGMDHLYLVNRLDQDNGRGPSGRRIMCDGKEPDKCGAAELKKWLRRNAVMRFDLGEKVADPSRVPCEFRPLPPVDLTEVKQVRTWVFDYDGGNWTINGKVFDPNRIDAEIEQDSAEIWIFRNSGSSWSHPIHSHFTEFIILEINGVPHYQGCIESTARERSRDNNQYFRLPSNLRNVGVPADETRHRLKNGDDDLEKMCLVEPDGYRRYVPGTNPVGGSGSFMGGPRRDIALLLPHDEVVVFMRWKDFLGKHVMHCHNVVHEDHEMMIRWEIVPPRHISNPTRSEGEVYGIERKNDRHLESRPSQSSSQENVRRGRPPIR